MVPQRLFDFINVSGVLYVVVLRIPRGDSWVLPVFQMWFNGSPVCFRCVLMVPHGTSGVICGTRGSNPFRIHQFKRCKETIVQNTTQLHSQ